MADAVLLPRTYLEARTAFLAAAAAAKARVRSFPHPQRGLHGEELAIDVAEVGDASAADVLIVVSGTHGIEGYLGSALQRGHLESLAGAPQETPAVVFVHALNPYGFSWMRRVNEDNVDLNRNFIDWAAPPPSNPEYADLAAAVVPDDWSAETQERTMLELAVKLDEVGLERVQQIISGGQYDHPTGVFYGGTAPAWSNRWLRDFLAERLGSVQRAAIVDLHTGLGPWGHGELISSEPPTSATYARQSAWWGEVTSLHDGSSVSAQIAGDWLDAAPGCSPGTEVTGIAIEYGTVDAISVLQALRADAVLHSNGESAGPSAEDIRAQVRAAFLDDDPAWLATCAERYRSVIDAVIDNLG